MDNTLVRAKGITKVYGKGERATVALDNTTFEVEAGSSIALVGPSGSGKTTLLHIIAGLDRPAGGVIEWPAFGSRAQLRPGLISLVFQGRSLLPALTVVENVALPLLLLGRHEAEATEAAWAILDHMLLTDTGMKLPEELSGGQSQRVGIARALVNNPALLLADEPTGQQDHENGQRLIDLLLSYVEDTGAALIAATHDMEAAERLSVIWSMDDGRLQTEGSYVQSNMD